MVRGPRPRPRPRPKAAAAERRPRPSSSSSSSFCSRRRRRFRRRRAPPPRSSSQGGGAMPRRRPLQHSDPGPWPPRPWRGRALDRSRVNAAIRHLRRTPAAGTGCGPGRRLWPKTKTRRRRQRRRQRPRKKKKESEESKKAGELRNELLAWLARLRRVGGCRLPTLAPPCASEVPPPSPAPPFPDRL